MEWGEDPNKWVITRSSFGPGWVVFPPNDGEASLIREYPFPPPCRAEQ